MSAMRAGRVALQGGEGGSRAALVLVKKVGGSAGNATTKCSWTYDVWRWSGDTAQAGQRIATGIQPLYGRTDEGKYDYAADDSHGLAFYDPVAGAWKLLVVFDEVPDMGLCDGA